MSPWVLMRSGVCALGALGDSFIQMAMCLAVVDWLYSYWPEVAVGWEVVVVVQQPQDSWQQLRHVDMHCRTPCCCRIMCLSLCMCLLMNVMG